MHARTRPTLSQQLEALPDGLVGEILNGQLHTFEAIDLNPADLWLSA